MNRIFGCASFVRLLLLGACAFGQEASLKKLEAEMERLARSAGGDVGATAIHLETGRMASVNAARQYPMASTFKIPVAVKLLELADAGEVQLDRMVTIEPRDLHPGSGTLSQLFTRPGVALSVRNLLELMLLISDNSATDVLLRLAGGPDAVTEKMQELGLPGIRVDRTTARLIGDFAGVANLPHEMEWTLDMWRARVNGVSGEERDAAGLQFQSDPRDTSTPADMARLLVRIQKQELHKPETAQLLVNILQRCQTGDARLKGLLPEGTEVAHKTGSIGPVTNDVGIITLPANAGHVALAVFVKSAERPTAARERAIAEIARAVHDFFLFQ